MLQCKARVGAGAVARLRSTWGGGRQAATHAGARGWYTAAVWGPRAGWAALHEGAGAVWVVGNEAAQSVRREVGCAPAHLAPSVGGPGLGAVLAAAGRAGPPAGARAAGVAAPGTAAAPLGLCTGRGFNTLVAAGGEAGNA
jgi:hypothetical protein